VTCPLDPQIRKYDFGFEEEGMSKSKHSEAQIVAALKQVEAGRTADDVARECGVSKHTIYAWKAKFGGMEASEAQKLRDG
jgi:putative transposase